MCVRFALTTPHIMIAERYWGMRKGVGDFVGRYNIAPGSQILTIRKRDNKPVFDLATWGFRPAWAQPDAPTPANARAETLLRSPYFQEAFRTQRCVLPATGWYEWQQTAEGKQPYFITQRNAAPRSVVFMAGVWTPTGDGTTIRCAIITEPAAPELAAIHARQPVVLDMSCLSDWLDPAITDPATLRPLVRRFAPKNLTAYPVSTAVNQITNDGPALIEPLPMPA